MEFSWNRGASIIVALLVTNVSFSLESANECNRGQHILEVSGYFLLDPICGHRGTIEINKNNSTLDCNSGVVDASGVDFGILIGAKGNGVENITIKNCRVLDPKKSGIMISRFSAADEKNSLAKDELYRKAPKNIMIVDTKVIRSRNVGVFVGDYVQNVLINNVEIEGAGAVSVYFEHSSKYNTVANSRFLNSGVRFRREAIAVDSSAYNVIENNVVSGSFGGVFLYKNCGENKNSKFHVKRWQPASHNVIRNNKFYNTSVAIWVASRQSKNLGAMNCSDDPYFEGVFFEDDSEYNLITNNVIQRSDYGVVVEDSNNSVIDNVFLDIAKYPIKIGGILRFDITGVPITGTSIKGNSHNGLGSIVENKLNFLINK